MTRPAAIAFHILLNQQHCTNQRFDVFSLMVLRNKLLRKCMSDDDDGGEQPSGRITSWCDDETKYEFANET